MKDKLLLMAFKTIYNQTAISREFSLYQLSHLFFWPNQELSSGESFPGNSFIPSCTPQITQASYIYLTIIPLTSTAIVPISTFSQKTRMLLFFLVYSTLSSFRSQNNVFSLCAPSPSVFIPDISWRLPAPCFFFYQHIENSKTACPS